jgi:hypothetical protein
MTYSDIIFKVSAPVALCHLNTPTMRLGVRRNDRDSLAGFEYDYRKMLNTRVLRRNTTDTTSMTALRHQLKKRMRVLGMKHPAVKMDSFRIMNVSQLW